MEHDFGAELDEEPEDEVLARELRNLNRAFDPRTNRPLPFHTHYDAGDAQEMAAATAAGNTMLVHLKFGGTIKTDPGVTRTCRLSLPRLCLVSFAKRAICRNLCPGLYPSFIRLSWPGTEEVLEDSSPVTGSAGAPAGEAGSTTANRTLASYDVGHQSVLQLDIVEGNIFEAFDYSGIANPGAGAEVARETEDAAAAAAATRGNPPAGGHGHQAANRAPAGVQDEIHQAKATRMASHSQKTQGRRIWTREETIALLKGILKHKGTRWIMILKDPSFAETLKERTGVNLKDKWVNLDKAADRNFEGMHHNGSKDTELINLIKAASSLVRATTGRQSAS